MPQSLLSTAGYSFVKPLFFETAAPASQHMVSCCLGHVRMLHSKNPAFHRHHFTSTPQPQTRTAPCQQVAPIITTRRLHDYATRNPCAHCSQCACKSVRSNITPRYLRRSRSIYASTRFMHELSSETGTPSHRHANRVSRLLCTTNRATVRSVRRGWNTLPAPPCRHHPLCLCPAGWLCYV